MSLFGYRAIERWMDRLTAPKPVKVEVTMIEGSPLPAFIENGLIWRLEWSAAQHKDSELLAQVLSQAAAHLRTEPKRIVEARELGRAEVKAHVMAVIECGYRGIDKNDKCEHGRYGFEDCIACYDEALISAMDHLPSLSSKGE